MYITYSAPTTYCEEFVWKLGEVGWSRSRYIYTGTYTGTIRRYKCKGGRIGNALVYQEMEETHLDASPVDMRTIKYVEFHTADRLFYIQYLKTATGYVVEVTYWPGCRRAFPEVDEFRPSLPPGLYNAAVDLLHQMDSKDIPQFLATSDYVIPDQLLFD